MLDTGAVARCVRINRVPNLSPDCTLLSLYLLDLFNIELFFRSNVDKKDMVKDTEATDEEKVAHALEDRVADALNGANTRSV